MEQKTFLFSNTKVSTKKKIKLYNIDSSSKKTNLYYNILFLENKIQELLERKVLKTRKEGVQNFFYILFFLFWFEFLKKASFN